MMNDLFKCKGYRKRKVPRETLGRTIFQTKEDNYEKDTSAKQDFNGKLYLCDRCGTENLSTV